MRFASRLLVALLALAPAAVEAAVGGRVIDDDGRPVAGAVVSALARESTEQAGARQMSGRARTPLSTVTTGADGGFRFDTRERIAWVTAEKEGRVPVLADASETRPMTLTLAPLQAARGRVTSARGPVAGALVLWSNDGAELFVRTASDGSFSAPDPRRATGTLTVFHPDFAIETRTVTTTLDQKLAGGVPLEGLAVDERGAPIAGATVSLEAQWPLATSDASGRFRIAHAPPEWQTLLVRTSALVGASQRKTVSTARVTLRAPRTVSGAVTDAGTRQGLAGVTVVLESGSFTATVDADARGTFMASGLPAGRYRAYAARDGYATGPSDYDRRPPMDLRAAGHVRFDVALERQPTVEGRIVDEQGRPVEGALVGLYLRDSPSLYMGGLQLMSGEGATRSAADGSFALTRWSTEDMGGSFARQFLRDQPVLALKEGFAAAQATIAEEGPTVVTLTRGVELKGRVTNADGTPLGGVEVLAAEEGSFAGLAIPTHLTLTGVEQGWARSGPDGTFSFRVHPREHQLVFKARGHAAKTVARHDPRAKEPLVVVLEPSITLQGRVVRADGTGVPDVAVTVESSGGALSTLESPASATGPDGTFELPDLAPGLVTLTATRVELGISESRSIDLPSSPVEIVVPPGATVRGTVVDGRTRQPLTTFTVWVAAGEGAEWRKVEVEDPAGVFSVPDVPFGDTRVTLAAEGYASEHLGPIALEPGVEPASLEAALNPDAPLVGRVDDAAGQPVEGAAIQVASETSGTGSARSDADGEFEVRGMVAGEMKLSVTAAGYVTARRTIDSRQSSRVDVTLDRGLALHGDVVRGGAPVEGVQVSASTSAHNASGANATSDAQGRFAIEGLEPGRYTLTAWMDGDKVATREGVDPATSGRVHLVVEERATGVVVGRVAGAPQAEGAMTMVSASADEGASDAVPMGVDGQFRLEQVPAGRVRVAAHSMSLTTGSMRTSRSVEIEVTPGSETEVVLEFGGGVSVAGRVVKDGAALAGATVTFSESDGGENASGSTDGSGAYRIEGLSGGRYSVHVGRGNTSFATEHELQDSGTFDIDVTGAVARGRVSRAQDGQPLAGVQVSFFALASGGNRPEKTVTSSALGTFQATELKEGRYRLLAHKQGFGAAIEEIDVATAEPAEVALQLTPADGLQLTVVDARDRRPLSANVVVRDSARRIVANQKTDVKDDGSFVISLADGAYTLSTSAEGFGTATLPVTAPARGLMVSLTPGGTLVIDSATRRRGRIRLVQPNGEEYVRCWCNGIADIELNGHRTTVENVTPGAYRIELVEDEGAGRPTVVVKEGQTSTVSID